VAPLLRPLSELVSGVLVLKNEAVHDPDCLVNTQKLCLYDELLASSDINISMISSAILTLGSRSV